VHCINAESQRYRARKQRNSAGAEKWMDIRMWDSPASCIQTAKASGYHVVATHFDPDAVSIHDVDWTQPTAVILGNEREGNSRHQATHFCLRRYSYCANKLLVHPGLPVSGCAATARLYTNAFPCCIVNRAAQRSCVFALAPACLVNMVTVWCCPSQHAQGMYCMLVKLMMLWQPSSSERVSVWF